MKTINLRKINLVKLATRIMFVGSIFMLAATIYFVVNIDVLTNWSIMLPGQTKQGDTSKVAPIHAGDQIVVQSLFTKLREVKGESTRYIECETSKNVFVAYPINVATADRPAGTRTGTGVSIVIPRIIPNLPTTCRIRITIIYPVLPFRSVPESATSDEFQLLPEPSTTEQPDESAQLSQPQTTPSQVPVLYRSSSSNTTPNTPPVLSDSSQETINTQQVQPTAQPSLLDRILAPVKKIIGGN